MVVSRFINGVLISSSLLLPFLPGKICVAASENSDHSQLFLKPVSTRAEDLLPPSINVEESLEKGRTYYVVSEREESTEPSLESDVTETTGDSEIERATTNSLLTPSQDRLRVGVRREQGFSFGFGSSIADPTALQGATRRRVSSAASVRAAVFPVAVNFQQGFGPTQRILFETVADPQSLGFDLSYTTVPDILPGAFSVQAQWQSSFNGAFQDGETSVELPDGDDPWVRRLGGGVEYLQPVTPALDIAVGH
jgi:outer membrane protein insertion porin family